MSNPSDEQLRTVLDASPIPLLISRVEDGSILYANRHLAALVGMRVEDLLGRQTPDFYVDPADRASVLASLRDTGRILHHEFRVRRADGAAAWMILSAVVTDLAGERVVVSGLFDIDQRRRAEEALRESETFVSAVLDTAGALVVVLDTEGRIVRFNRACETTTGYSFAQVKGRPFWELFLAPEEAPGVRDVFRALCEGRFPNRHENDWVTRSGERRRIAWSNTALTDADGAVTYVVATGIDITEQSQAEAALAQSAERIWEARQDLRAVQDRMATSEKMASLGSLVAGIAHEINTPVGAIGSSHDTVVRAAARLRSAVEAAGGCGKPVETALKAIDEANEVIASATTRVLEIVRSLRSFARHGGTTFEAADIHTGIDDSLTLVHHDIKNRIQVVRNYGDLPPVPCVSGRLNQVWLNLLVNAAQAIPERGQITITTGLRADRVFVEIADTGTGIPEGDLGRIFDAGFTTKDVASGTGLGLSICRQIVEDHEGEFRVESTVNEGTRFTVTLPLCHTSAGPVPGAR